MRSNLSKALNKNHCLKADIYNQILDLKGSVYPRACVYILHRFD